jgi:outer membrane protein assembly factor BamE (lipoprotein component of BamABCDE complex)
MKKNIVLGLAMAFLCGCASSSKLLNNVHLGMGESDVVKILGSPDSEAETKSGKVFYYTLRQPANGTLNLNAPYFVKFVGGKVDEYGRQISSQTENTVSPMPIIIH